MFPGMGRINPKQLQAVMRQMGIKSEELAANRVVFELEGKKLVIEDPKVTVVEMQGEKTYTVMGRAVEQGEGVPDDDVKMVASQAGVSEKKAKDALEKNSGDIAMAIKELKEE